MENTNTKSIQLTDAERKLINNFDEGTRGKEYGQLRVKKYLGKNSSLLALNGTAKHIGVANYVASEGVNGTWYVDAIDGERYRIPEPNDGIDTLLDTEFKRKDV